MKNIFNFFKKHSWMWIVVIVIIAIIGDAYLTKVQKPSVSPTPVAQVATFRNITPGISSETDLNKIWGTPIKTSINGQQKTDEYKGVGFRNQIAIIENGKVSLIREIVGSSDTRKADSITSVYGNPPDILYSNFPHYPFQLYIYPSNGIAYLGSTDGTLSEIWYFTPTTIDDFIATWASGYSLSQPTEITQ